MCRLFGFGHGSPGRGSLRQGGCQPAACTRQTGTGQSLLGFTAAASQGIGNGIGSTHRYRRCTGLGSLGGSSLFASSSGSRRCLAPGQGIGHRLGGGTADGSRRFRIGHGIGRLIGSTDRHTGCRRLTGLGLVSRRRRCHRLTG